MKKISLILTAALLAITNWQLQAQCTPAGTQTVFGNVTVSSGTVNFTNVPTGNVIQLTCPAANTQYHIDLCGTNPGTNVPSGTNDGFVTILDANSAAANALDYIDDGCSNMAAPGYGPPVGDWTAPAAGTYFIYLTEYDALGNDPCTADGVNNSYDFAITVTGPPSNDLAIDSAAYPSQYATVTFQQLTTPFTIGARVKNQGSTAATNVTVSVRVRDLVSNTVVNTQTLSGPASLAAGTTAYVAGTPYTPSAALTAYEFRYICSMTQADANTSNDTAYRYVLTDTSLLAYDQASIFGTLDNVLGVNGQQAILGQKFQINVATEVDTVMAYFAVAQTSVGQQVRCVVYNTAAGLPTTQLSVSPSYTFQQVDTPGKLVRFAFAPGLMLSPGSYFFGIEQQGTVNMGLGQSSENFIKSNALFSVSPYTSWNPIELAGFPGSFVIWLDTKLNCSLVANGAGTNATCGGSNGSATINITGNNGTPVYSWSNGGSGASISNLAPGTYVASVTAGGCLDTASVTITNSGTNPQFNITPTAATCGAADGDATVNITGGTGPFTYAWSNSGTGSSISNVSSGSYTVTVTSAPCSATGTVFIGNTGGPSASATATDVSCFGGSNGTASVTATNGTPNYTYSWSNSGSSTTISGVAAGTYTVTVADANNCLATASVTVNEPTAVTASAATSTAVSCFGTSTGAVTATANGGTGNLSYLWSNATTGATASNLPAGSYSVVVTDANSCTASASVTLTEPAVLAASNSLTDVLCHGGSSGSASVAVTGGTTPYTYSWSSGQTTSSANNLAAGTYTVSVTDAHSCSLTASSIINEPTAIGLVTDCTPTIQNQSTGTANVVATGGTPPYTYHWGNGSDSANAVQLATGTVNVTVTDANNCTANANCDVQFTIGVAEIEAGIAGMQLYPNPSSGKFTVAVNFTQITNVEVSVFDAKGAVVFKANENGVQQLSKSVDLTGLAKGIYTLQVKTTMGSVNKRVITE